MPGFYGHAPSGRIGIPLRWGVWRQEIVSMDSRTAVKGNLKGNIEVQGYITIKGTIHFGSTIDGLWQEPRKARVRSGPISGNLNQ